MSFILVILAIITAIFGDFSILSVFGVTLSPFEISVLLLLLAIYFKPTHSNRQIYPDSCSSAPYEEYDSDNGQSSADEVDLSQTQHLISIVVLFYVNNMTTTANIVLCRSKLLPVLGYLIRLTFSGLLTLVIQIFR